MSSLEGTAGPLASNHAHLLQQHLQRAMTHLPLNPVERFVLLQRQDREAVTTLPDLSVGNFRPLENPTPHHVGRSPQVGSTAAPVGEDELAEEFSNASELQGSIQDIPRHVLSSRPQRFVGLGLLLVNPNAVSALSPVVPSAHAVLARFVEEEGRELETKARRGDGAQPAATWLRSATRAANHIAAAANATLIATDKAAPGSAPSVCGSAR
jgi:hypothetical protein